MRALVRGVRVWQDRPSPMAQKDLTGIGEINALLGRGTEYEGKLVFEGRVRIDGRFVGEIHSDDLLILGEGAEVRARVRVGTLIVRGGVLVGDVVARQLVEIHAPGQVRGDITTPQLFIDKGVVFEGRCTMGDEPSERLPLEDEDVVPKWTETASTLASEAEGAIAAAPSPSAASSSPPSRKRTRSLGPRTTLRRPPRAVPPPARTRGRARARGRRRAPRRRPRGPPIARPGPKSAVAGAAADVADPGRSVVDRGLLHEFRGDATSPTLGAPP